MLTTTVVTIGCAVAAIRVHGHLTLILALIAVLAVFRLLRRWDATHRDALPGAASRRAVDRKGRLR